jgi:hypothetical protein
MRRKMLFGLVLTKVEDLQPGMVISVWHQASGAASTVAKVEVVERPGMRYNYVKLTMADGTTFLDESNGQRLPLTGTKVGVWPPNTQTARDGRALVGAKI